MSFISESQLSNYRVGSKSFSRDDIVTLNERYSGRTDKPTIFLSHKHDEYSILQNVISFLKNEGVDVYVDWMDEDMPSKTCGATAIRLKERIRAANKFILVATPNAINSKWCNWELGFGDALKYIDNIALLPIDRQFQSFNGAEYLQIYPRIEYENGTNRYTGGGIIPKGYYVIYPSINGRSTILPLENWLKRS